MSDTTTWETEDPFKPGKSTENDLVFAQIGYLRRQGLEQHEVIEQLLEWAHQNRIGFSDSQLKDKVYWTYRHWDL
jgi:hypothetical protein